MTISVIIPTYNRGQSIGRAIESVLAQTVPAHEIIVIDDGSTDDTTARLQPLLPHIVAFRQANAGVSAARNAGLDRATGAWVAFLDSDDIWRPDWLATVAAARSSHPDAGVVVADLSFEGPGYDQRLFAIRGFAFPPAHATRVERPLAKVIGGLSLIATACRLDWVRTAGRFDPNLRMYEDLDLLIRLAQLGPWLFTPMVAARAQRLDEPAGHALTAIAARNQARAQASLAGIYAKLIATGQFDAAEHRLVAGALSAALFGEAKALRAAGGLGQAMGPLLHSAQRHPSAIKGWSRAALMLGLGQRGYDRLTARRRGFHREDHET